MDMAARLLDKECSVGEKEIGTEPKHHQARFGHLARHGILKAPIAGSIAHDHCCMGTKLWRTCCSRERTTARMIPGSTPNKTTVTFFDKHMKSASDRE